MDSSSDLRSDNAVKSLTKVTRLLECFSTTRRSLSLADLCAATGYPRSTTHRLLSSMREVGLLDQDRQRDHYRLGLKLFELGNLVLANLDLHREARPFVESLSRMSGHAVHLAIFDGRRAIVVHRADPAPDTGQPITLIESAPVHCTSVGKAILAFQSASVIEATIESGLQAFTQSTITEPAALRAELAQIRARGYAVDDSEHQPGLRCIGAPIRDHSQRVIGAISVSAPTWKLPTGEVQALSEVVVHHANQISAAL